MAHNNDEGERSPNYSFADDRSLRNPHGDIDLREIISIAKDSNIDPTHLIAFAREISKQMHTENMKYWEARDKKLNMDYELARKNQDYGLILSVVSIAAGSLIAYLVDPWVGATITGAGASVAGIATLKKMVSKPNQILGRQAIHSNSPT